MNITPLDIKQKQFSLKFRGFNMNEVDSFLEEITYEMETLMRENDQLREEVKTLQAALSEFKETEKNLRDTLMAAQKISEEMRLAAEKETALRLKQAEMDAEELMRKSRQELTRVEREIEELNRVKERFALKIKGVIEDHLKMLDYEEKQGGRE
ncbi:MAG: DivIVA domain-containing protein [Nitrospirota bacterium]